MAVMPGADFLNAATSSLMTRYDIVCLHTIVGYAPAHAAHFSTKANGYVYQSRDTKYRSAANLNGNYRVLAIENEDHGSAFGSWNTSDGHAVPAFTAAQCESIAKILVWCHQTHGIPLVLAPDSKPGSRGIAYHRQGVDGNFGSFQYPGRVAGGEVWSTSAGKVCPGDRRIAQLINTILPRARQLAGVNTGGFLMALSDAQQTWLYNAVGNCWAESDRLGNPVDLGTAMARLYHWLESLPEGGATGVLSNAIQSVNAQVFYDQDDAVQDPSPSYSNALTQQSKDTLEQLDQVKTELADVKALLVQLVASHQA